MGANDSVAGTASLAVKLREAPLRMTIFLRRAEIKAICGWKRSGGEAGFSTALRFDRNDNVWVMGGWGNARI
jgi:hypothetical protein